MDNQHKHIKGYRDLSAEEIALMNEVKTKAEEVGVLIEKLQSASGLDQRAVAIGKTEAQTAFMWLVRAVAQPTTF
jgi:UDP-glucose 6-dehydrogenase